MLLNVIFSPFPPSLSFFSSSLPSPHSISFFSNLPTLGEFHGPCDLPPYPTLLPNHINSIEQVDSTAEKKETKIHCALLRCQAECKNAEYRQTSSVAYPELMWSLGTTLLQHLCNTQTYEGRKTHPKNTG